MATSDKAFSIVSAPEQTPDAPKAGHGTIAYPRSTLSGDIVEKRVSPRGTFAGRPEFWLDKAKAAQRFSDAVRALNNPAYYVPKTYISHGKVYEEKAPGVPLSELSRDELRKNQEWIIPAIANFINDMSELHPMKRRRITYPRKKVPGIIVSGENELSQVLLAHSDIVSKSDRNLIIAIYRYLLTLPECSERIWSHNDLHAGNIFIDTKKHRVAFIDFEMTGYNTKLQLMYHGLLGRGQIREYINNKLERKTNPDLTWNYDDVERQLYRLVWWAARHLKNYCAEDAEKIPSMCASVRHLIKHKRLNFNIAKNALENKINTPMALVPMSHYQKD